MNTTAPTEDGVDGLLAVPAMVGAALDRLRTEQHRACQLLADAPKCRRLSALYEHEARLWTLLVQHTADHVYRRAAVEAQCAARSRAREYAELARHWTAYPATAEEITPAGAP